MIPPIPTTLVAQLRQRARNQPHKLAYIFLKDGETEETGLTYAQLDIRVRAIAAKLQSLKTAGGRVLLLYPSGVDYIAAFFGCLYADMVAVPIYPPHRNRSDQRLQAIAGDAQATVILTTTDILSKRALRLNNAPNLKKLYWIATDILADELAESWVEPNIHPDTLAFLQYTSGSTGTPKGVMVSHGNLLHNSAYMTSVWQYNSESVMVSWLPIFHDMGLIFGILQPLYQGFSCYLMSPAAFIQRPIRWLQAISRYRATHSGAPNFAYELCVNKITEKQRATLNLSHWDMSLNAAEPVRADTFKKFAKFFEPCGLKPSTLCHGYGLAEATLIVGGAKKSQLPVYYQINHSALEQYRVVAATNNEENVQTLVGYGRPATDAKVVIANPQTLMQCQTNIVGEIWVSSPSVAYGYWQRPVETTKTFQAYLAETGEGPFLRTGDLGFIRDDGELFVTGRLKDIIIIRGNNYYPQDIELTVEQSHSTLRSSSSAAFSVEVEDGERLAIVQEIERTAIKKININEVFNAIRQAISEQYELQVYAISLLKTATIPKTSSGKIQRGACRIGFLENTLDTVAVWQQDIATEKSETFQNNDFRPVTVEDFQTWLLAKLSQQLKIPASEINIYEPLAHYGMNSMIAVTLSGEVKSWLGQPLSPMLVYDYPSIESLSHYLAKKPRNKKTTSYVKQQIINNEAIAIIGIGCRFPGANNPQEFWKLLQEGRDAITEVPQSRWDANAFYDSNPNTPGKMSTRWGGFLEEVAEFDPQFFGIAPLEAKKIDPQQRLLLEISWEALEHAGIAPDKLAGSQTGVFIGISTDDYATLQLKYGTMPDAYFETGRAFSIAANRLSYVLDLQGPSLAIDTACSSSLVAVHQACQSLHNGESDLALAGGVNLILNPGVTIAFSQANMMAADGHCKTFDASADGYVRGEGCGIVILKRASEALRDGDNIIALVKGSAVNQDGRTNGLMAPNSFSQQAVVRQALKNADVAPAQISYVEAHGTGTSLGDPIEVNALKEVLMDNREQSCWIGSVKTNIGHLEAAAGITGLIKVALSLQHEEIVPHLHLKELNPLIAIADTPFKIPTQRIKWQTVLKGETSRFAGVSSFGFGGTNAHVILERPTEWSTANTKSISSSQFSAINKEPPFHLLTLSAKSENALGELALAYEAYFKSHPMLSIADVCYTANMGRSHFEHRLAIVADSIEQLREQLKAFNCTVGKGTDAKNLLSPPLIKKKGVPPFCKRQRLGGISPKIAFLFTGQGAQYVGMGQQLYETQLTFRQTLKRCDEILRPLLEIPLLEVLYPSDGQNTLLNETSYTQSALFALEYALAMLWQSWGVMPSVVMGHSVGEYVAACVAGVFSLEDGLKLIAERGRLMQTQCKKGDMVAVSIDEKQAIELIKPYTQEVSISAINGANSIVISGKPEAITSIMAILTGEGIKTKRLSVSRAFHSPLMEPMLADFAKVVNQVAYSSPKIKLVSNVTGEFISAEIAQPDYWLTHVCQPVKFAVSMTTLYQQGYESFVEIGPKPTLLGMGCQCLPDNIAGVWLPSLRPELDWQQLLQSLGELYVRGVAIDWESFNRDYQRQRVILPTYPFQRQRYWIDSTQDKRTDSNYLPDSSIFKQLQQGQTEQLTQQLEKSGQLSADEIKSLPKILKILAQQQQQIATDEVIKDWLYEVEWQPQAHKGMPPDYIPDPTEISNRLNSYLVSSTVQLEFYQTLSPELDAVSVKYILNAFKQMGWTWELNQRFKTTTIAKQLGVVNQHEQLLARLLDILTEEGLLQHQDDGWKVSVVPDITESQEQIKMLLAEYPSANAQLTLLARCATKLADVLQGKYDPLQLLFPNGDLTTTTQLYQDSPFAQVMNTLVQKTVLSALENLPQGQGVRILEIGAGTGGTTAYLLPHLPAHQTEYFFTDISPRFTTQATEKFSDYSFIRYQQLDIEQTPNIQGFDEHEYDIIVAANVLHATKDLKETLQNIQSLLAPGGMLVLFEGTTRQRWIDLTFGLTEGWWRFTDHHLRPDYPLLSSEQWQTLLQENGFIQTAALSPLIQKDSSLVLQQAVIVAKTAEYSQTPLLLAEKEEKKFWLILADSQEIGQQLAALVRAKGDICILVFSGRVYEQIDEQTFRINIVNPTDFQRLFDMLPAFQRPLTHIVHLWSLDAVGVDALTVTDLETAQKNGCGSTLYLVQSLIKQEFSKMPSLWLVTQGVVPIPKSQFPNAGLAQSPLWGMGKVIALEHPELNCRMVDLELETKVTNKAQILFEEIGSKTSEDQIAFRNNARYVARLVRYQQPVHNSMNIERSTFQLDGTYLITGGLGGLGLLVADWMVKQGAKHLVLVGRSGANPTVKNQLKALEQAGAKIVVVQADISIATQIAQVLMDIEQSLPPLRGIIHAAGVLDDGVLSSKKWAGFEKVMVPKVQGVWNLHTLIRDKFLDFFILFSSATSLLGSIAQANHAAANTFLDALAHYRRTQSLPCMSINWGAWSKIGAAAERNADERMRKKGLGSIDPQQGLQILEQLFSQSISQVGVIPINWSQFLVQGDIDSPFFSELTTQISLQPQSTLASTQVLQILQQLKTAESLEEYRTLLPVYLQEQMAVVFKLPTSQIDDQKSLTQMGLDSLMAVEIRNRIKTHLGIDVPLGTLMKETSIFELAMQMASQLITVTQIEPVEINHNAKKAKNDWIEVEI